MKKTTKNGKSGGKRKACMPKQTRQSAMHSPKAGPSEGTASSKARNKQLADLRQELEEIRKAYSFYKGNLSDLIISDRK